MTLTALAEQAGVAKSTVSLIERGQGNPSIETVWALASALGVPFSSLFHDEPQADDMSIVRESEAAVVGVDQAGLDAEGMIVRHLLTRTNGELIEIYTILLAEGAVRHASPHVPGLFEHITVAEGTVEISTESFAEELHQGDLISFRSDRAHTYRVIDGPVRLVSVHEYPKRSVT
jgi:transcriptional regulator with XRE-family HTH domain